MRTRNLAIPVLLLCGFVLAVGCADSPKEPKTGQISALVIDESLNQPLEGVSITLTPGNIVATTDENGVAVFEVPTGEYFVDAIVCCAGPGGREYHLSVTVREGQTAEVKMQACLRCE